MLIVRRELSAECRAVWAHACEKDTTLDLICRPFIVVIGTVRAQAAVYDCLLRSMARQAATRGV